MELNCVITEVKWSMNYYVGLCMSLNDDGQHVVSMCVSLNGSCVGNCTEVCVGEVSDGPYVMSSPPSHYHLWGQRGTCICMHNL